MRKLISVILSIVLLLGVLITSTSAFGEIDSQWKIGQYVDTKCVEKYNAFWSHTMRHTRELK